MFCFPPPTQARLYFFSSVLIVLQFYPQQMLSSHRRNNVCGTTTLFKTLNCLQITIFIWFLFFGCFFWCCVWFVLFWVSSRHQVLGTSHAKALSFWVFCGGHIGTLERPSALSPFHWSPTSQSKINGNGPSRWRNGWVSKVVKFKPIPKTLLSNARCGGKIVFGVEHWAPVKFANPHGGISLFSHAHSHVFFHLENYIFSDDPRNFAVSITMPLKNYHSTTEKLEMLSPPNPQRVSQVASAIQVNAISCNVTAWMLRNPKTFAVEQLSGDKFNSTTTCNRFLNDGFPSRTLNVYISFSFSNFEYMILVLHFPFHLFVVFLFPGILFCGTLSAPNHPEYMNS